MRWGPYVEWSKGGHAHRVVGSTSREEETRWGIRQVWRAPCGSILSIQGVYRSDGATQHAATQLGIPFCGHCFTTEPP